MKGFTIQDNTVSAVNQMINSSDLYYLGDKDDNDLKVLIVGNSITRHGPSAQIGWEHDYGMAASSQEKDYVHVLYNKLCIAGYKPYFMVRQASFWERNYFKDDVLDSYTDETKFNADVLVFRLGENVADVTQDNYDGFVGALDKYVNYITTDNTKRIFTTCFWQYNIVDNAIKQVAQDNGKVVTLGDLGANDEMRATGLFWHSGVAGHPGDKGMENIAERICNAICSVYHKL